MLPHATRILAHDHTGVDRVLTRVHAALKACDASASHAALDLFWARLAVHIRAEHLRLFPTLLSRINKQEKILSGPSFVEAESIVDELRADHDFFMHELARAVETARKLSSLRDPVKNRAALNDIRKTIADVERRLRRHNEIEEQKIYRWAGTVLSEREQTQLARQIQEELAKRPQRFTEKDW